MKTRKLSEPQRTILENVRDGRNLNEGMSKRSGVGAATRYTLTNRGLIRHDGDFASTWRITDRGEAALTSGRYEADVRVCAD